MLIHELHMSGLIFVLIAQQLVQDYYQSVMH